MKNQLSVIVNYLAAGNTLTTYKAVRNFGILSLSSRVSELIYEYEMPIKKRRIKNKVGKTVMQYYL